MLPLIPSAIDGRCLLLGLVMDFAYLDELLLAMFGRCVNWLTDNWSTKHELV